MLMLCVLLNNLMLIIKDLNHTAWLLKIWVSVYTSKSEDLVIGSLSTSLKCKRNDLSFNKLIVHTLHINGLCIKIYGLGNLTSSLSLIISRLTEEFCRIFKGRNLEFEGLESIYIYLNQHMLDRQKTFFKGHYQFVHW